MTQFSSAGIHPRVVNEPTAHLDHASARLLADQVLCDDGERTVVWITHEPIGLDHVDTVVQLDDLRRDATPA
jgi:ATP-binding cassette, subfamily C, bacterial CydCD